MVVIWVMQSPVRISGTCLATDAGHDTHGGRHDVRFCVLDGISAVGGLSGGRSGARRVGWVWCLAQAEHCCTEHGQPPKIRRRTATCARYFARSKWTSG